MPAANGGWLPWTQRVVLLLLLLFLLLVVGMGAGRGRGVVLMVGVALVLIWRLCRGELGQLFLVSEELRLREVTGLDVPDELVHAAPDPRAAEAGPRLGRDSKTHENPSGIASAGARSPSSSPRS